MQDAGQDAQGEKTMDATIEYMGSDCLGNDFYAPVLPGRLTSVTGEIYPSRAAARAALDNWYEEQALNVCEHCPNCRACGATLY
jgi:hypothetical protein